MSRHVQRVGAVCHSLRRTSLTRGECKGEGSAVAVQSNQESSLAFRVERQGIDYIPQSQRWATPRAIAGLWGGVSTNVQYFVYGALLMGFGFNFPLTVSLILLGNLSYFLLGIASLQGPEAGTTTFTIVRAPFGTRGARPMAFFNWITQLGFETEGLILIVGGAVTLSEIFGYHPSSLAKVIYIVLATAIMVVLPYFGHATMVRVLRLLIIPFVLIYVALVVVTSGHWNLGYTAAVHGFNWQIYSAALAFSFTLAGLSWTENGNDYTRYLPRATSKRSLVWWIFAATALPQISTMLVGATAYTAFGSFELWNSVNPFDAMLSSHQTIIPVWFVVLFLVVAIVQLFGINALDLYSSGVSLQALGLRLKRYQAVVVDGVIAGLLTIWVTFGSTFSLFMKEFVGVVIVWIAPWFGIFITDWLMRARRYDHAALHDASQDSTYFGSFGVNWNAFSAFIVGVVAAISAYSKAPPPVNFPFHWMTPLSNHFGSFYDTTLNGWWGGADFSIPLGIGGASLTYWVLELANRYVGNQRGTHLATGVHPRRLHAFGLILVAGGATMGLIALVAALPLAVALVVLALGCTVVGVGIRTSHERSDRYRDLAMTLNVTTVVMALVAAALQPHGVELASGATALGACGLIGLLARLLLARGPQNHY